MAKKLAKTKSNSARPTIYIYDEIGNSVYYPAVGAKDIISRLDEIGQVPDIDVRINSPGGDVFEGDAIYNALTRHPAKIHVHIDGLAASAASYIAMAGDSITIAENGFFMVHEAWTFGIGNKRALGKTIEILSKIDEMIAKIYAARTGKTMDEATAWMVEETWFDAAQAVEAKLADSVSQPLKTPSEADAKACAIAVARFSKAPEALRARLQALETLREPTATPRLDAIKKRLAAA